jgi:transposase
MARRKRRAFTREYKQQVVEVIRSGGRSAGAVAKDLDLSETAVRRWMNQTEVDAGRGGTGALTTAEREELVRLRRENRTLAMEREILRKAAAFFAKENA